MKIKTYALFTLCTLIIVRPLICMEPTEKREKVPTPKNFGQTLIETEMALYNSVGGAAAAVFARAPEPLSIVHDELEVLSDLIASLRPSAEAPNQLADIDVAAAQDCIKQAITHMQHYNFGDAARKVNKAHHEINRLCTTLHNRLILEEADKKTLDRIVKEAHQFLVPRQSMQAGPAEEPKKELPRVSEETIGREICTVVAHLNQEYVHAATKPDVIMLRDLLNSLSDMLMSMQQASLSLETLTRITRLNGLVGHASDHVERAIAEVEQANNGTAYDEVVVAYEIINRLFGILKDIKPSPTKSMLTHLLDGQRHLVHQGRPPVPHKYKSLATYIDQLVSAGSSAYAIVKINNSSTNEALDALEVDACRNTPTPDAKEVPAAAAARERSALQLLSTILAQLSSISREHASLRDKGVAFVEEVDIDVQIEQARKAAEELFGYAKSSGFFAAGRRFITGVVGSSNNFLSRHYFGSDHPELMAALSSAAIEIVRTLTEEDTNPASEGDHKSREEKIAEWRTYVFEQLGNVKKYGSEGREIVTGILENMPEYLAQAAHSVTAIDRASVEVQHVDDAIINQLHRIAASYQPISAAHPAAAKADGPQTPGEQDPALIRLNEVKRLLHAALNASNKNHKDGTK